MMIQQFDFFSRFVPSSLFLIVLPRLEYVMKRKKFINREIMIFICFIIFDAIVLISTFFGFHFRKYGKFATVRNFV